MRQRLAPRLVRAVAGASVAEKCARGSAWLGCLLLVASLCAGGNASAASTGFRLQVAALIPGSALSLAQAYDADGCHGDNRSPALHWSGAPAGTRSFAVTVFDRDAHHGRGGWHGATWSIPATRNGLAAGAGDRSAHRGIRETRNDFRAPL